MFDRFGKMKTVQQLNAQASLLKQVGDAEGLITLARENGLCTADADWYMEGKTSKLASLSEAAIGRIRVETEGIDVMDSVVMYGLVGIFKNIVRNDADLQEAIMRSDKSAVDCLCLLMQTLAQTPDRPADLTPWGKLVIPDLSRESVREIIEEYYLGWR